MESYTKKDIQVELKRHGLKTSGNKAELVDRLDKALNSGTVMSKKDFLECSQSVTLVRMFVRKFINNGQIRQGILGHFLNNDKNVIYGETIELGNTLNKLNKYMNSLLIFKGTNKIILFTVSNTPSHTGETHFYTFIIHKNKLLAIDPSRDYKGRSMYHVDNNAAEIVMTFFSHNGYDTMWNNVNKGCECQPYRKKEEEKDVFCQTWSIFLQINYAIQLLTGTKMTNITPIDVCGKWDEKLATLLPFMKIIINLYCSLFNKQFKSEYKYIPKKLIEYLKLNKQQEGWIKDIDACKLFQSFTTEDMYY